MRLRRRRVDGTSLNPWVNYENTVIARHDGNPVENISQMKHVKYVMKDGVVYKDE